jgi:hypothetical protein
MNAITIDPAVAAACAAACAYAGMAAARWGAVAANYAEAGWSDLAVEATRMMDAADAALAEAGRMVPARRSLGAIDGHEAARAAVSAASREYIRAAECAAKVGNLAMAAQVESPDA